MKPAGPEEAKTSYLMHACAAMLRDVLATSASGEAAVLVVGLASELDARAALIEEAARGIQTDNCLSDFDRSDGWMGAIKAIGERR